METNSSFLERFKINSPYFKFLMSLAIILFSFFIGYGISWEKSVLYAIFGSTSLSLLMILAWFLSVTITIIFISLFFSFPISDNSKMGRFLNWQVNALDWLDDKK